MTTTLALLGLSFATTAAALELAVPTPGLAGRDNTLSVTGATPGLDVVVLKGESGGTTAVPGCPGLVVAMRRARLYHEAQPADAGGATTFARHVSVERAGQTWRYQAVQLDACEVSNPISWTWPAGRDLAPHEVSSVLTGEVAGDEAGSSVDGAGDVDGDGYDDIVVGAPHNGPAGSPSGAAYLIRGPAIGQGSLGSASLILRGETAGDRAGASVTGVGDVDGDGSGDLLVGAFGSDAAGENAGAAYLVNGSLTGEVDLADATAILRGSRRSDYAGYAIDGLGDLDGDGFADILVGAHGHNGGGTDAGAAYVLHGPLVGELDLDDDASARLLGESAYDAAGVAVAGAGDVDGDGVGDLVIGAYGSNLGGRASGAAYLVLGPVSGDVGLGAAHARLLGEGAYDYVGESVAGAGDVDGDGFDDLLIAGYRSDFSGDHSGSVYLVTGPVAGDFSLGSAAAIFRGASTGDEAGVSLAEAGDVDGDGFSDFLVGAHGNDVGATDAGAAYLVYGPVSGRVDVPTAAIRLYGESPGDALGISVAGVGDVDADGRADVLVGARRADTGGVDAGAAYLMLGNSL